MTHYYHPLQWAIVCYHHSPSSSHYVSTTQRSSFIFCPVWLSTHHLPFAVHHHHSNTFHSSLIIYNPLPPIIHHHHSSITYYIPPSPSTTCHRSFVYLLPFQLWLTSYIYNHPLSTNYHQYHHSAITIYPLPSFTIIVHHSYSSIPATSYHHPLSTTHYHYLPPSTHHLRSTNHLFSTITYYPPSSSPLLSLDPSFLSHYHCPQFCSSICILLPKIHLVKTHNPGVILDSPSPFISVSSPWHTSPLYWNGAMWLWNTSFLGVYM